MADRNKRKTPQPKTSSRRRSAAARKRAESIRRERTQSQIGENIDLFLENAAPVPLPSTVPVERDQAQLRQTGETGVELPPRFGRTRIVLLTRDPEWMYAWWEVTPDKIDDIARYLGPWDMEEARMILRVYDVTGIDFDGQNATESFDIEIEGKVANWYIHAPRSGRDYIVELGLRTADRRLIRMARSNPTHVPLGQVSPTVDEQWTVRQEDFVRLYQLAGGEGEAPASGGAVSADLALPGRLLPPGTGEILSSAGLPLAPGASEALRRGRVPPPPGASESLYPGREMERPGASEALYSGVFAPESLSSDRWQAEGLSSDVLSSPAVGRPGRLPTGRGNEGPGVAGGGRSAVPGPEADDFWLVVRTELILYGATEADAQVTVKGHPIRLRPDGTFTMRFDLPDGQQDLEVRAVKANGRHRRSITPRVRKWTEEGRERGE